MKVLFSLTLLTGFVAFASADSLAPRAAADDTKPQQPKATDKKALVVPFELLDSRHMAIQIKVNGKGPYRVIFDTGAPYNVLSNKVAKDAGMLDKKDDGAGGLFGLMGVKPIKTFEVGAIRLDGMSAMVMDHPTVKVMAEVLGPIEGIIGYPFFARYKMTIDYQKKELTLVPNGFEPGDPLEAMMKMVFSGKTGVKPPPGVVAPAAAWGFAVDKPADDKEPGVTVTEVLADTPAAKGGLKPGDRLLTLDARWTDTVGDTFFAASRVQPGRAVTLVVKRDGKELKLSVTPVRGL